MYGGDGVCVLCDGCVDVWMRLYGICEGDFEHQPILELWLHEG